MSGAPGARLREMVRAFQKDAEASLYEALEEAYHLGLDHRDLKPDEQQLAALHNVLDYARFIESQGSTDWEQAHLASAIEAYDAASCTTPTGRRDGHFSFIETDSRGRTVCAFCKCPAHQSSGGEAKPSDSK